MKYEEKDNDRKSPTVEDIVCKWYSGAAIGAGVGTLCGNILVGVVVGAAAGFIFQISLHSKNGKKKN